MAGFSYRLLDPSGSEIATVSYPFAVVKEGETVFLPGGGSAVVLEVHNDEHDRRTGCRPRSLSMLRLRRARLK